MLVANRPSQLYYEIEEILGNEDIIYEKGTRYDNKIDRFLKKSRYEDNLPVSEELEIETLNFQKIIGSEKFYEVNLGKYEVDISVNIKQLSDDRWVLSSISSEEPDFAKFLESYLGHRMR